MHKNFINKLYWGFWCSTIILIGIMAGFMISHSLMLGRFFTWFIESDNVDLLCQTFSVFRGSVNYSFYYSLYLYPLLFSLISGVIWTVLSLIMKRDRIIAIIAGLSTLWVGIIFITYKFGTVEDAVVSGIADETTMQLFASINVPIHTSFALIYTISFLLLLIVVLKKIKKSNVKIS